MATQVRTELTQEVVLRGLPLPITIRSSTILSDDELLEFSRRNDLYRIERSATGELTIMTPVGGDGGRWETVVIQELGSWSKANGGVCFSSSTGFSLADGSMLSPDASWISAARWNGLSKADRRRYPPLCPDFIVEVLSASDSRTALEAKMRSWMSNGARLAWMIDPYQAKLTVFRSGEIPETLYRPDSVEAGEPVPGFRLSTLLLWDDEA
jgi:Uma2 family endonuclease